MVKTTDFIILGVVAVGGYLAVTKGQEIFKGLTDFLNPIKAIEGATQAVGESGAGVIRSVGDTYITPVFEVARPQFEQVYSTATPEQKSAVLGGMAGAIQLTRGNIYGVPDVISGVSSAASAAMNTLFGGKKLAAPSTPRISMPIAPAIRAAPTLTTITQSSAWGKMAVKGGVPTLPSIPSTSLWGKLATGARA